MPRGSTASLRRAAQPPNSAANHLEESWGYDCGAEADADDTESVMTVPNCYLFVATVH